MNTRGVQSLICQINSFLKKKITKNERSQEEIETFRQKNVIELTVHGDTTEMVNIILLEEKFKNEGDQRRVVPSHDILQYTSKFPLHETSNSFLDKLHKELDKRMKKVETSINEKSILIDEQIFSNLTKQEAAQNIVGMFSLPNNSVEKQLGGKIERALNAENNDDKKNGTIEALKTTFALGIELALKSENKAKWGALNNRRGQIGENRTAAAMAYVLDPFMGIGITGMKTHTFLAKFLQNLNIKLTYQNEYDPVTKKMTKANEVEHDNLSTWIDEDSFVLAVVQSKVMEIKPSKSNLVNETQVAVKHATMALNQVKKDLITFQEMFPDISESMLNKIKY